MEIKCPTNRFQEFNVKWSTSPASDIFLVETDKGHPELPVLSASQELGMIKRDNIGINMQYSKQNIASYKHVQPGRFVIHLRSFQGGFAHSSIEGITSPAYTVLSLREPQKHNDLFWKYLFTSPEFIKRLELVTYGIRDGRSISVEDFFELPFCFPSTSEEQKKIAKFFSRLDTLIAEEDKKLSRLKNMKAASLEKMFPKPGETVPQVRFKGFSGKWKEHKLGDYLSVYLEKNEKEKYTKYDIFSVSNECGVINQIKYQGKSLAGTSLKGYKVAHKNMVIYTKSPLRDQPYGIIKSNKECSGIVSALYAVYSVNEGVCSDFVQIYFASDNRLNNYLRPIVNKGAKNTLLVSDEGALSGSVVFPVDIKEQISISSFFSRLDILISAEEQKLTKLRSLKKSFLEKMFVNIQN